LAIGCDMPSGALPARVTLFDHPAPAPTATITQTILVTAANGAPIATEVHLVLDSVAPRLGVRLGVTPGGADIDSVSTSSDAQGVVAVPITFGRRSGRTALYVRVPETGIADSIVFDLSKEPVTLLRVAAVTPAHVGDTVAFVWYAYGPAGTGVFGDPVVTVADSSIAVVRHDTLFAKATGYTWIRAAQGGLVDSVPLAVVPYGRMAALVSGYSWIRFDLDGTAQTAVFSAPAGFADPRATTSGDTLVYTAGLVVGHLQVFRPGPVVSALVPAALGFTTDRQADWSGDGQWVYFAAGYADDRSEVWRIHPDGSGAQRAGPAAVTGQHDGAPSVSSDGTLLAFVTDRTLAGGQPTVRIITTASGAVVWSGPAGTAPRFSPAGDRLAFLANGRLQLVNADGTALTSLAPSLITCFGQLAWSPDGNWVVVGDVPAGQAQPYLNLVHASLGTAIRLPYSPGWTRPVWR
jgi:hypothetical protein